MILSVSVGAVLAAFVATGFLFWGYGVSPFNAYATIFRFTLGDVRGLAEVLRKTIPLLLAGVGLVLAFRAQFYNIGAEGQLLLGAAAASGVALFAPLPGPLLLPAMFVAGFLAGAFWGLLPALLKVRLGVNEIITTLMMNYVALYFVQFLVHGPWRGESMMGFAYTDLFAPAAQLPTLLGTRLHLPTLLIGLLLAVAVAGLLARTKLGFEIRVMGESPEAARYAGINFLRVTLLLVLFSAGAAGLAGVGEVAGVHHRLLDPDQISLGYGYTAIIVALLARGSALAAVPTALLMGFVFAAGDVAKASLGLPAQVTGVMSGLVLLFLIGAEPLIRNRLRRAPTASKLEPQANKKSPEGPGEDPWTSKAG